MDEYIKRETLLQEVAMQKAASKASYPRRSFVVGDVISCIRAAPASDVVPVAHGRWEPGDRICPVCKQDKFKDLDADIWADWTPPYCPNCGAKMDGGENNENKS